jgi:hypothetical protein
VLLLPRSRTKSPNHRPCESLRCQHGRYPKGGGAERVTRSLVRSMATPEISLAPKTCTMHLDGLASAMPSRKSVARIRAKVLRALRDGTMPIDIARKLHIPMLLVAEVIVWEATLRHAGGTALDT